MDLADETLLEQWRVGDERAGSTLFRRHFDTLYRFYRPRVADSDIDEMIQTTFMAVVESRDRFAGTGTFRSFLLGIARNKLLMYIRDRRHARPEQSGLRPAPVASPTSRLARVQNEQLLVAGLRALSMERQIMLELYYWEGLSLAEMEAVLEVPADNLKTRLHRARLALREKIRELAPDRPTAEATVKDIDGWVANVQRSVNRDPPPPEGNDQG